MTENLVIFIRNQNITPIEQRNLAKFFGPLHIHPIFPNISEVPEIMVLDNSKQDLQDNENRHTDVTFIKNPPLGCVLYAKNVPDYGGDTLWSSSLAAYDALSNPLKKFLDRLTAIHDISKGFPVERFATTESEHIKLEQIKKTTLLLFIPLFELTPLRGGKVYLLMMDLQQKLMN